MGRLRFSALIVGLLVLSGCGSKTDPPTEQPHESELTADWTTPSMAEAEEFARRLEEQAASDPSAALDRAMAWPVLFDRITGGFGIDKKELAAAERDWTESAAERIGGPIAASIHGGGSYELLRVHTADGQPRALFRLLGYDGTSNYHDYVLLKRPDGQVKAIDMFVFLSGEPLSQSMRRMFLPFAAEQNKGLIDKLGGRESDHIKNLDKFQEISSAIQRQDYATALRVYKTLPASLKKDKSVMIIRLHVSGELARVTYDMSEYDQAIKELHIQFAEDPSLDLLSANAYLATKQYDKALVAIDRLDKSLGGDPFLDAMRGSIWINQGKLDMAQESIGRARQAMPDTTAVFLTSIGLALAKEDHQAVLDHLIEGEERFGLQFNDLTTMPEYKNFIRSPQYQQWKNRQQPPD